MEQESAQDEPRAESDPEAELQPERDPEAEPEPESDLDAELQPESDPEAEPEPEVVRDAEHELDDADDAEPAWDEPEFLDGGCDVGYVADYDYSLDDELDLADVLTENAPSKLAWAVFLTTAYTLAMVLGALRGAMIDWIGR